MQHVEQAGTRFHRERAIGPTTPPHVHIEKTCTTKKQQQIIAISSTHTHIFSLFPFSQEIKSPRSELNELFIRGLCVRVYCCVYDCVCLTLCVPVGKHRGHMLKMKMDIYHHRELREGERRREVVAGGNEKWGCREGGRMRRVWDEESKKEGNKRKEKNG